MSATLPSSESIKAAKRLWASPSIHIIILTEAKGSISGPLCDKHGSLSATQDNDRCSASQK
jgi:hypothetical protein